MTSGRLLPRRSSSDATGVSVGVPTPRQREGNQPTHRIYEVGRTTTSLVSVTVGNVTVGVAGSAPNSVNW
jgi:hypothetical protein